MARSAQPIPAAASMQTLKQFEQMWDTAEACIAPPGCAACEASTGLCSALHGMHAHDKCCCCRVAGHGCVHPAAAHQASSVMIHTAGCSPYSRHQSRTGPVATAMRPAPACASAADTATAGQHRHTPCAVVALLLYMLRCCGERQQVAVA